MFIIQTIHGTQPGSTAVPQRGVGCMRAPSKHCAQLDRWACTVLQERGVGSSGLARASCRTCKTSATKSMLNADVFKDEVIKVIPPTCTCACLSVCLVCIPRYHESRTQRVLKQTQGGHQQVRRRPWGEPASRLHST